MKKIIGVYSIYITDCEILKQQKISYLDRKQAQAMYDILTKVAKEKYDISLSHDMIEVDEDFEVS